MGPDMALLDSQLHAGSLHDTRDGYLPHSSSDQHDAPAENLTVRFQAGTLHKGGTDTLCFRAYLRKRKSLVVRRINIRILLMSLWKWYVAYHRRGIFADELVKFRATRTKLIHSVSLSQRLARGMARWSNP